MLYRKIFIVFVVLFFTACSLKREPFFAPSGPTDAKINNSEKVKKATMRPYTINGKTYYPTVVSVGDKANGIASWYGPNFQGKKTSNGEIYNMYNLTAAHKTLPMNTIVRVINLNNGKEVVVRINDRGPFVANRIIDLSKAAAEKISMMSAGTAPVNLEVVGFYGDQGQQIYKSSEQEYKLLRDTQTVIGGGFMVQIGAFKNPDGAKRYRNSHRTVFEYSSVVKTYNIDGALIYRVFLTGFRSEDEARDFAKSGHFNGAFIVRE